MTLTAASLALYAAMMLLFARGMWARRSAGLAIAPGEVMAAAFAATCVVQTAAALTAVRVLRGWSWLSWRYLPLELVRSYVGLLCWVRACVSRRIEWRGHAFTMMSGTRIVPIEAGHERSDRARLAA